MKKYNGRNRGKQHCEGVISENDCQGGVKMLDRVEKTKYYMSTMN